MNSKLTALVKKGNFDSMETIDIIINGEIGKQWLVDKDHNPSLLSFYNYMKELQEMEYTITFE